MSWKANFGSSAVDVLENTTGAEREELEAKLKGIENPWHEAWCVEGRARQWQSAASGGAEGGGTS